MPLRPNDFAARNRMRFWPTWLSAAVVTLAAGAAMLGGVGGKLMLPRAPAPVRIDLRASPPVPVEEVAGATPRQPRPVRRKPSSSRRMYTGSREHLVVGIGGEMFEEPLTPAEVRRRVNAAGEPVEVLVIDAKSGSMIRATLSPGELDGQSSWRWFYAPLDVPWLPTSIEEPARGSARSRGARTAR